MSFDLNMHTSRLLTQEPFFAALSRRVNKVADESIPTAGVRVNPDSGQFEMFYNPKFFESLTDIQKRGVLKHEFYHLVFEHVTGRLPEDGMSMLWIIATDLAINSHLMNELPEMAVFPGKERFAKYPIGMSSEWYLKKLEKMAEEQKQKSGEGDGDPFGGMDSLDDHDAFGDSGDATVNEIAKERLKEAIKKAAEEAEKARNWGSVSSGMRRDIMDRISPKVDWRKVLRYFVKTSQRADKRSTPRRSRRRAR